MCNLLFPPKCILASSTTHPAGMLLQRSALSNHCYAIPTDPIFTAPSLGVHNTGVTPGSSHSLKDELRRGFGDFSFPTPNSLQQAAFPVTTRSDCSSLEEKPLRTKACTGSKALQCPSKPQPWNRTLPLPAPYGPSRFRAPELSNHHLSPDPSAGFIAPSHTLLPLSKILLPASYFLQDLALASPPPPIGCVLPIHCAKASDRVGGDISALLPAPGGSGGEEGWEFGGRASQTEAH